MTTDESDRMRAVIDLADRYYTAMIAGDDARLRGLFDARAPIMGHENGAFVWLDLDAFIAETQSLVGQHGTPEHRVESIRIDGDIAAICVAGRYAGLWIVDHLIAVDTGGRWVITAKSFHIAA